MQASFYKLMLVTHRSKCEIPQYLKHIDSCVRSGVTSVQLREKNVSESTLDFAKALKAMLGPRKISLIVNDDLNLAMALNADGVHLGQRDADVRLARTLLGRDKIIGLSVNSIEQLHIANFLPIDYVGIGAVFPTQNKENVETLWGLDGLREVSRIAKHPVLAIGGINESNANAVMRAGANGIAAIGAFHDSQDPGLSTANLLKRMELSRD